MHSPTPPAFQVAFHHALPHGVLTAVRVPATAPGSPPDVPDEALSRLAPAEADHAATLGGYRRAWFVAGRLALREARRQVGAPLAPVLPDDRGAPAVSPGWAWSVSHKGTLAVAMVARDVDGSLGVDLEEVGTPRNHLAARILRPPEAAAVAVLPDEHRRWVALLLRFSMKEALYKALDPYVRRYVDFTEAEVWPDLEGGAEVMLHLRAGEGPFSTSARYAWLHGWLLTSVRVRRR